VGNEHAQDFQTGERRAERKARESPVLGPVMSRDEFTNLRVTQPWREIGGRRCRGMLVLLVVRLDYGILYDLSP